MPNPNPREEFINAIPENELIPEYLEASASPEFLTVEDSQELLEHTMIQTFLDIMTSGKNDNSRISAARNAGELVGHLGQKQQNINLIKAENVQMNQIEANPDLKRHLIESASGLQQMATAHDSGIKTKKGGSGV